MAILEINQKNFAKEVLNSDQKVLVDFNASWCGPCRMLSPILEEISSLRSDVVIASVNIDSEEELARKYNIMSIPCLVLFKDGSEINRSLGLKPREEIEKFIGD